MIILSPLSSYQTWPRCLMAVDVDKLFIQAISKEKLKPKQKTNEGRY